MWWMFNSIKIALIASVGIVIISTISAYAFSRVKFRGRSGVLDALFIIQIFPTTLALIAVYSIFDGLGDVTPVLGIDSHWSVILVYMSWVTLHIWTIKGYFDSVDPALDKAANIDGATPWQTFRHVFLPLAVPMIEVPRRLIRQKHRRIDREGACDGGALLLTARKLAGPMVHAPAEAHPREEALGTTACLDHRGAANPEWHHHVLEGRELP